jgi:hypothetical protein
MVKLPLPPDPSNLHRTSDDLQIVEPDTRLWRVHRTGGEHVVAWNRLRYWGPAPTARFDPHEPPPHQQDRGVSYTSTDIPTALAEVFQATRVIDTGTNVPYLTGWRPTRAVRLLDLAHGWPLRNGAAHTLNSGRKNYCRAWAHNIHTAWPDLDGLWSQSAMTGRPVATLFTYAADTFPPTPDLSMPLAHPGLRQPLAAAASAINYLLN